MAAAVDEKKDALQSLRYTRGSFEVLDQLVVPHGLEFLPVKDANDGWSVIRKMQVRGAPLIAMVACLSLAVEATAMEVAGKVAGMSADEAKDFLLERMQHLRTSRPTAVNLFVATDKFAEVVKEAAAEEGATGASVVTTFVEGAEAMLEVNSAARVRASRDAVTSPLTRPLTAHAAAILAAAPPPRRHTLSE